MAAEMLPPAAAIIVEGRPFEDSDDCPYHMAVYEQIQGPQACVHHLSSRLVVGRQAVSLPPPTQPEMVEFGRTLGSLHLDCQLHHVSGSATRSYYHVETYVVDKLRKLRKEHALRLPVDASLLPSVRWFGQADDQIEGLMEASEGLITRAAVDPTSIDASDFMNGYFEVISAFTATTGRARCLWPTTTGRCSWTRGASRCWTWCTAQGSKLVMKVGPPASAPACGLCHAAAPAPAPCLPAAPAGCGQLAACAAAVGTQVSCTACLLPPRLPPRRRRVLHQRGGCPGASTPPFTAAHLDHLDTYFMDWEG